MKLKEWMDLGSNDVFTKNWFNRMYTRTPHSMWLPASYFFSIWMLVDWFHPRCNSSHCTSTFRWKDVEGQGAASVDSLTYEEVKICCYVCFKVRKNIVASTNRIRQNSVSECWLVPLYTLCVMSKLPETESLNLLRRILLRTLPITKLYP